VPTRLSSVGTGKISIGKNCIFNYGVTVRACKEVRIGDGCLFGSAITISDGDAQMAAPIIIESGVWIAHGARILPGVRIGQDAVVSAGSVVTSDVPPGALAVGDPARHLPMDLVTAS